MKKRTAKPRTGGGRRDPGFDSMVGARIKNLRIKKKLSQGELGEKVGVSGGQISRYESGETACETAVLAIIADRLGCKPGVFVDDIEVPK